MRKPTKPCKRCHHKKGSHLYNAHLIPGGEGVPALISYPCQDKGCTCVNFIEMTLEEKIKVFGW